MKCLSIRQPWAWLIANGYKDIENRSWWTSFRGRFLIHASSGMTRQEYTDCLEFIDSLDLEIPLPAPRELRRGGIIGSAVIYGCAIATNESHWFVGPFGFKIRSAVQLHFTPLRGRLSFFDLPAEHEISIASQLNMHCLPFDPCQSVKFV